MRIVFSTFGTFGDVNPLIALALELKRRGHTPVLAVPGMFREKVEPLGIEFAAVRPDQDPHDKRMVEMVWDIKKGTERGLREFLFPAIRESYQDLLEAVSAKGGADLLVTGELAYAGPIIAEKTGIPWASYVLAPLSFFPDMTRRCFRHIPFCRRCLPLSRGSAVWCRASRAWSPESGRSPYTLCAAILALRKAQTQFSTPSTRPV